MIIALLSAWRFSMNGITWGAEDLNFTETERVQIVICSSQEGVIRYVDGQVAAAMYLLARDSLIWYIIRKVTLEVSAARERFGAEVTHICVETVADANNEVMHFTHCQQENADDQNLSKHETLSRCWANVGPPSTTLAQYWPDISSISQVY